MDLVEMNLGVTNDTNMLQDVTSYMHQIDWDLVGSSKAARPLDSNQGHVRGGMGRLGRLSGTYLGLQGGPLMDQVGLWMPETVLYCCG